MRILFADGGLPHLLKGSTYPAGGWSIQLRQILVGLAAAGHHGGVLTWKGANAYVGPQSVCDLVETYDPRRGIRKLRLLYYFLPSLYLAARAWKPDVIVQSGAAVETGSMALIARWLRVPFVHRISSDKDADGRYAQRLGPRSRMGFRYGLKRAQLVICQNTYQLGHINARYPLKPAGILHNCVCIPPSCSIPRPRTERRYVAWVGNFRRPKNMPLLYHIASQSPEIAFRIAGILPEHDTDSSVLEAVEKLQALQNVTFAGFLQPESMPEFLESAIALLCTSDFEGFSNALLEALAAATPVVLRAPVDPDGIVGKHGLGLVARDAQELKDALDRMYCLDAAAHEQLALRCRRYVEQHHTAEGTVRRLLSLVEPLSRKVKPSSGDLRDTRSREKAASGGRSANSDASPAQQHLSVHTDA